MEVHSFLINSQKNNYMPKRVLTANSVERNELWKQNQTCWHDNFRDLQHFKKVKWMIKYETCHSDNSAMPLWENSIERATMNDRDGLKIRKGLSCCESEKRKAWYHMSSASGVHITYKSSIEKTFTQLITYLFQPLFSMKREQINS